MTSRLLLFAALPSLCAILALPSRAGTIGAYWSFQDLPSGGTYAFRPAVTFSTLQGGTPTFTRTGTALSAFDNFGPNFTAFDGTVWSPGKCATWVGGATGGPTASSGNSFSITFDSTNAEDFQVRFMARNSKLESGGSDVTAFTAFEYDAGSGFVPVPGADLSLPQTTAFDYVWTADFSSLAEIENSGTVTLRWTLPDFDNTVISSLYVDDLQITAERPPVTIDFDPSGEYDAEFSNNVYTEDATGGLGGSVGINLLSVAPTSYDSATSQFLSPGQFSVGTTVIVGGFFNFSSFGTLTGDVDPGNWGGCDRESHPGGSTNSTSLFLSGPAKLFPALRSDPTAVSVARHKSNFPGTSQTRKNEIHKKPKSMRSTTVAVSTSLLALTSSFGAEIEPGSVSSNIGLSFLIHDAAIGGGNFRVEDNQEMMVLAFDGANNLFQLSVRVRVNNKNPSITETISFKPSSGQPKISV